MIVNSNYNYYAWKKIKRKNEKFYKNCCSEKVRCLHSLILVTRWVYKPSTEVTTTASTFFVGIVWPSLRGLISATLRSPHIVQNLFPYIVFNISPQCEVSSLTNEESENWLMLSSLESIPCLSFPKHCRKVI
jgi:hypothetical protein